MEEDGKYAQVDRIRQVLATVLMSDDHNLIDETNKALLWFKENPDFLIKDTSSSKD